MTSAIAKELPPYRLDTVNSRHAGGERFRVHVLGRFRLLGGIRLSPSKSGAGDGNRTHTGGASESLK
jgi:hypothetical protein